MINLKKSLRLAVTAMCAGAAISVAASAAVAQDRVGDFALLDHEGVYHNMSWYDNNKAVALFVQVNGDAASQASLEHIDALRSAYEAQGVVFMMINPLGQARDSVRPAAPSSPVRNPVRFCSTVPPVFASCFAGRPARSWRQLCRR